MTYVLESLNTKGSVVWVEIDQSQFQDIEPKIDDNQEDILDTTRTELMLTRGRMDRSTIVEYSITVYYTKEFKESTADPITFIDQVLIINDYSLFSDKFNLQWHTFNFSVAKVTQEVQMYVCLSIHPFIHPSFCNKSKPKNTSHTSSHTPSHTTPPQPSSSSFD